VLALKLTVVGLDPGISVLKLATAIHTLCKRKSYIFGVIRRNVENVAI
jgi:hypothetical protein